VSKIDQYKDFLT